MRVSLFFILIILFTIPFFLVANANADNLVISEIMPNPIGDDSKLEWIELQNKSNSEQQLSDWKLNDKLLPTFVIKANSYIVLVRDEVSYKAVFSQTATIIKHDFSLVNSGGKVTLTSKDNTISEFNYPESMEGISFELLDGDCKIILAHKDSHTSGIKNTSCANPSIAPTSLNPTPTFTGPSPSASLKPTPTTKPDVSTDSILIVINKVLPNPESGDEWLELKNLSNKSQNIKGWKLYDESNKSFTLPDKTLEPSMDYRVFPSTISLNNDGDTIRLYDNAGLLRDIFQYGKSGKGQVMTVAPEIITTDLPNQEVVEEISSQLLIPTQITQGKIEQKNNSNFKKPILYRIGDY